MRRLDGRDDTKASKAWNIVRMYDLCVLDAPTQVVPWNEKFLIDIEHHAHGCVPYSMHIDLKAVRFCKRTDSAQVVLLQCLEPAGSRIIGVRLQ